MRMTQEFQIVCHLYELNCPTLRNQTKPKTMYKPLTLIAVLLIVAFTGCATHKPKTVALAPIQSQVEELPDSSITRASLEAVLPQFSRGAPPAMISLQPAYSMHQALPNVQKLSRKPVVAMTKYGNWYWYATDVERNPDTQAIQNFLSGYAVQKGGYLAWKW